MVMLRFSLAIELYVADLAGHRLGFLMRSSGFPDFFSLFTGWRSKVGEAILVPMITGRESPIVSLLLWSFPSTIAGGISSIVVNAANSMYWTWRVSHILKKRKNPMATKPFFTDGYASSAIVFVFGAVRVKASSLHPIV